jgi:Domain of unknown function (DUF4365)
VPSEFHSTREHVIADLSVNHLERQALYCGFSVERIRLDYGIDLIVHTYKSQGEVENGRLLFQLKATNRIHTTADGRAVICRLEKADLLYWLGESMPVVVVQYDARNEVAYWFHVQKNFRVPAAFAAKSRVTIRIPSANVLDRKGMKQLTRRKNRIVAQQQGAQNLAD